MAKYKPTCVCVLNLDDPIQTRDLIDHVLTKYGSVRLKQSAHDKRKARVYLVATPRQRMLYKVRRMLGLP